MQSTMTVWTYSSTVPWCIAAIFCQRHHMMGFKIGRAVEPFEWCCLSAQFTNAICSALSVSNDSWIAHIYETICNFTSRRWVPRWRLIDHVRPCYDFFGLGFQFLTIIGGCCEIIFSQTRLCAFNHIFRKALRMIHNGFFVTFISASYFICKIAIS